MSPGLLFPWNSCNLARLLPLKNCCKTFSRKTRTQKIKKDNAPTVQMLYKCISIKWQMQTILKLRWTIACYIVTFRFSLTWFMIRRFTQMSKTEVVGQLVSSISYFSSCSKFSTAQARSTRESNAFVWFCSQGGWGRHSPPPQFSLVGDPPCPHPPSQASLVGDNT